MRKELIAVCVCGLTILLVLVSGCIFNNESKSEYPHLSLSISMERTEFMLNETINITYSLRNDGNIKLIIYGDSTSGVHIYENGYLTFNITALNGSYIKRDGGIHGIGDPVTLSPGEHITATAELLKYYPLEDLTGTFNVRGIYTCHYLDERATENNGKIWDGEIWSNSLTFTIVPS